MELSKATDQTYTVGVTGHAGLAVKQVRAQAVITPCFPPQITLLGSLSDQYKLAKPLTLEVEAEDDGSFVASESVFFIFGSGHTRLEAVKDYVKSLCEYYELLSEQRDAPTVALFRFVSDYVQPTSR